MRAAHAVRRSVRKNPVTLPVRHSQIGVIGDSLTVMASNGRTWVTQELVRQGWAESNIRVDGLSGRFIAVPGDDSGPKPYTPEVVDSWRAAGFDPRVWLISLGTNNKHNVPSYWQSAIQTVVNKIMSGPADDYQIYWIGTGYKNSATDYQAVEFQNKLLEFQSNNDFFTAANYNAFLTPYRSNSNWDSWWNADGIHNTNAGYEALRVKFYGQVVAAESPKG